MKGPSVTAKHKPQKSASSTSGLLNTTMASLRGEPGEQKPWKKLAMPFLKNEPFALKLH